MPILYKVINRKDPRAPEGPGKYYASKMGLGMVTTKLLAKEIAERAGQSEGTVLGLLQDLQREVLTWLQQGYSVRLGNIGILYVKFNGLGADSAEKYDPAYIMKVMVRVHPSTDLKSTVSMDNDKLDLQRYTPTKAASDEDDDDGSI